MFAVINHLQFQDAIERYAEKLQQDGIAVLSALPGFQDFYFIQESETAGVVIILWDSPEHAKNGAEQFGPTWFARHIAPFLASEQRRMVGPVLVQYEPSLAGK